MNNAAINIFLNLIKVMKFDIAQSELRELFKKVSALLNSLYKTNIK